MGINKANPKRIKVRQFSKEGKLINDYESMALAERSLGLPKNSLSSYFSRRGNTLHGFKWKKIMGIRMTTPMSEITAAIKAEAERANILTIRALSYLGELCVVEAKDRPQESSWFDQSGNLRSSIGYVIVHNGKIIKYSEFNQVKQGSDGIKEGKELATELAKQYTSGYALIVVAGMNYAELVEAMDNKNVLASAELFARSELPNMMAKLKTQIAS